MRDELRENRGRTYFNTKQVQMAIDVAPPSVHVPETVNRDELEVLPKPFKKGGKNELSFHWLVAHVVEAVRTDDVNRKVDISCEELAIANELFLEDNDVTDRQVMWLGALAAPGLSAAQEALEPLEDIIPASISTGRVGLIPWVGA